jgi:two-component system sensor histidine kinase KdpD
MIDDYQPDPDELLRAIQKEESQEKSAKLKIFFGMSAGVGKTYAMLEDAQRRLKEGVNVVIGTVNTHGRKETEALLQGLPIIPEKWVNYRDTAFEEMDLEAILKQKPSIVLVDELAHTNVPGSRHAKRWQDVIEILDAGINVYTSLNVQHIESRKDIVESIAGIQIRETVPDLLLERATAIELIDIPPTELLQRLKEGKVYLGNQSQIAARNFFKEDTLMALREIALRFTAEKVDHDLHAMLTPGKDWKTREKLMVAISASPLSVQLIRKARRRAFELDATWIALHVDTGRSLSDEEQTRLMQHLNLAQELGAEVITVQDASISSAINHIAHQKNITQLVIGRPHGDRWLKRFFRLDLVDRLERENKQLDLLILRDDQPPKTQQKPLSPVIFKSSIRDYIITLFSMVILSGIGLLLHQVIESHRVVGFTFLLGILLLSFFLGPGPILLAAVLSSLIWNFIFIPPMFSFTNNPEDLIVTLMYIFTASLVGILTYHTRQQERFLKIREKKLENLYEIEHEIANSANYQYLRLNVCSRLETIFNGKFDILVKNENNQPLLESPLLQQEKEQATAQWVFQNGKEAGWSTSTLPSAQGLYLPIKFSNTTLGVLVYYPKRERLLSLDEMNILQTINKQLGIYLERYVFEERMRIQ